MHLRLTYVIWGLTRTSCPQSRSGTCIQAPQWQNFEVSLSHNVHQPSESGAVATVGCSLGTTNPEQSQSACVSWFSLLVPDFGWSAVSSHVFLIQVASGICYLKVCMLRRQHGSTVILQFTSSSCMSTICQASITHSSHNSHTIPALPPPTSCPPIASGSSSCGVAAS